MKKINWNIFETKFNGQHQDAFQRLSYALFCSQFNQENGIHSYKNQIGIEADPIEINGRYIGFQAKYLEPTTQISAKKLTFIESIEKAKSKNTEINEIYFFINKYFSESKKEGQKKSKCLLEIEKTARELDITIVWQVPSQIEMQLSIPKNIKVLKEFFPELVEKEYQSRIREKDQLLEISRTAQIQIEIEKLTYNLSNDWNKTQKILDQLFVFTKFQNEKIASQIFEFLNRVSNWARNDFPTEIASAIDSLIIHYFPSSFGEHDVEERIENGKQCIFIGFNLAYDAFIYSDNYSVARYGLNIWKYIYRESKRSECPELQKLSDLVLEQYTELEETLQRPERDDLEYAMELVQVFKEDLKNYSLSFPVLSEKLLSVAKKYKLEM